MWPFTRKKAEPPPPEPEQPPAPLPETELARIQREVFDRIVNRTAGPAGIDDWRLEIYAGMYEARTHDALIEDVPHTAKLLGEEFHAVVKRYVAAQGSTHHSLAHLGYGFAPWLRQNLGASRVDLADLAELEWARSESFIADDFEPVESEVVQQMGPERFTAAWMQFVPSLRLLELTHDVVPLWKALEQGTEVPLPSPAVTRIVVWRKGFEVFHVAIPEDEHAAMKAVQNRETIAAVCERFSGHGEDAAHVAFRAIGSWLNEGMVAALREKTGTGADSGLPL